MQSETFSFLRINIFQSNEIDRNKDFAFREYKSFSFLRKCIVFLFSSLEHRHKFVCDNLSLCMLFFFDYNVYDITIETLECKVFKEFL